MLAIGMSLAASALLSPAAQAATITVNAGGNVQAALDAARPGDTILLQAGAVFSGSYKLAAKGGTAFITIRSSAVDASLPPAGSRISPLSAPLLAKVRATPGGPAFRTAAGATNWRLLFLEIYPSSSTSSVNLVEFGAAGPSQNTLAAVPQHLVIDRCYLHGDASYGQRRGIALNSGDTQILNSYFSDFKGTTQDTQAIAGWNGPGPFNIDNNYLEAAGENILFGGGDPNIPNLVPSHITIRHNLVTKPLAWRTQAWTVKNLIELKNADTVLIEGNTIENNWAAGQQGYAIVLTPRNQEGTAPWAVVQNVTVQNNIIRHVAAVLNVLGFDDISPSQQTSGLLIRNNLAYDVSTKYGSAGHPANGWFAVIGAGPKDIVIDHNTVDNDGTAVIEFYSGGTPATTAIPGFVLTNNLMRRNRYGVFGASVGEGTIALGTYAPGAVVLRNTFAGGAASLYPIGNMFPSLPQWLSEFSSVGVGNYHLVSTSQWINAASTGQDLGVNFTELNAAMIGSSTSPIAPPSDIVIYRPGNGVWYSLTSSSNYTASTARQWGLSSDVPVPGDYDGDRLTDLAVFRPSLGLWFVVNSSTGAPAVFQWGAIGDIPVPGDYDGDRKTDLAVFRPSTGTFYVFQSTTATGVLMPWGMNGDIPVPGDYDGDGKADAAVFRPSTGTWFIMRSGTKSGELVQWGAPGDRPVSGDFDGDGKTDPAIYRPSTGSWYVMRSSTHTGALVQWGTSGDVPVPGDYDGDGAADVAVYRPSTGTWYIVRSTNGARVAFQWGTSGDLPVQMR